MASKQKKWKTVTEADLKEFIENLDDAEYYPDSESSDNDDNDEDSFCNLSDADENNTDDVRFVRNKVPKKLTFETLSESLNEQDYDPVVPQERKIYKANVEKDEVLKWTTKPNNSRKRNVIIRNKPGPSRRATDIKTPLDSWSLLMTDDILLEIVTNTNKNIEAFVNEHVGFDENDKITFTEPTNIREIRALIGLFYLFRRLNQNLHSVKDLFHYDSSCDVFAATMNYMRFYFLCQMVQFFDKETRAERWHMDRFTALKTFFESFNVNCATVRIPSEYLAIDDTLYAYRGMVKLKQYNPNKPARYGLLYRSISDSCSIHLFYITVCRET